MSSQHESYLSLDYTGMMQSPINPQGFTRETLMQLQPELNQARAALLRKRDEGGLDFSQRLPEMASELIGITQYADWVSHRFDNFVVLGIGGSALGPMAVQQALNPYYYNELSPSERSNRPRLYVLDNVDPVRVLDLLETIDLKRTLFNVISKSGNTSETMAQFLIIRERLQQECGENYRDHLVVTTDPVQGHLRRLALEEDYKVFVIPPGIGGRFSELTPVGLLPAAVCGIDVESLIQGALDMDAWVREEQGLGENPGQMRAALSYLSWQSGKNISVFMPYSDALKTMADWYAQLWAESLGKRYNRQGAEVRVGQTPVKALGVTDQHSQIQLYAEGPDDKVITFVTVREFASDVSIPVPPTALEGLAYLGGHTLGELMQAEQQATEYALSLAGRLHQKIFLPRLDAYVLGQLLLLLEWETAYMGELLNINAFDQPGVEEGKQGTYALLGRNGYEQKKNEILAYGKKRFYLTHQREDFS
ncbi:glucose-6-phosphate isomerase [Paradesulfitobacterium ferrireducens]|uniref:glucose-6-phosphate isomerase n=1 Tax=Paradesulfitobacterium ferrireducens TaxID=2816476 RepID=UPI001A8BF7EE|nr:glucose-6-phosphate isomerase [Paradesulfitobacterium ferrireducens]